MNETCVREQEGTIFDSEYIEVETEPQLKKVRVYDDGQIVEPVTEEGKKQYLKWIKKGCYIPTFNHGGHEHV